LLRRPERRLFRRLDFPGMKELLKTPLIFDGRNQYSPPAMNSSTCAWGGVEVR